MRGSSRGAAGGVSGRGDAPGSGRGTSCAGAVRLVGGGDAGRSPVRGSERGSERGSDFGEPVADGRLRPEPKPWFRGRGTASFCACGVPATGPDFASG